LLNSTTDIYFRNRFGLPEALDVKFIS